MTSGKNQWLWVIPLAVAVVVGSVGWWANQRLGVALEGRLKKELQTILDADVTALEIWMQNQERLAISIRDDARVSELAKQLLARSVNGQVEPDDEYRRLHSEFSSYLNQRLPSLGFVLAHLVTTDQTIIADTGGRGRMLVGRPIRDDHEMKYTQLFETAEPVIITPFIPGPRGSRGWRGRREGFSDRIPRKGPPEFRLTERGQPPGRDDGRSSRDGARGERPGPMAVMQVAAPVKDGDETIGALAFIFDPEKEATRILSVARAGVTGETFAFDQDGMMISKSRFDDQLKSLGLIETNATSALNLELRDPGGDLTQGFQPSIPRASMPLTRMVESAVNGNSNTDVVPFRDYRGVPVVGAWSWLDNQKFGVATKVDAAEAYRPLEVLKWLFVVLFLMLVISALGMLLFSYLTVVMRRRFEAADLKAKRLGQYMLVKKIGEGGMGVVYKAKHALLKRDTAVKLLLPENADREAIARFEREVQLTCRLTHSNTIQIFDYGHTPDGIFYYAMEYLAGLTLKRLVETHGWQPEGRVVHLLSQVCASLQEAHDSGLVHRDIKPANIFLCRRGGIPDTVKVLDFGLVKHLGGMNEDAMDQATATNKITGTPQFMSPEAIRDPTKTDRRSDLYSVGALGYYLLTGSYVFEGQSVFDICHKHVSETPVPPGERRGNPTCPILEKAILTCLEKDPDARPQSAAEVIQLLQTSEKSRDWSMAQRVSWWNEHASESITSFEPTTKTTSPLPAPTLQIELPQA